MRDATIPSYRHLGGLAPRHAARLGPRRPGAADGTGPHRSHPPLAPTTTLSGEAFLTSDKAAARPALIAGELRLPFPLRPGQKVPAVVLVHGSGGIGASTDLWARELNAAGVGAFILDSFAGQGITSTVQDQTQLHSLAMMVDPPSARSTGWPRIRGSAPTASR